MEENGGHPTIYGMDAVHGNAMLLDTSPTRLTLPPRSTPISRTKKVASMPAIRLQPEFLGSSVRCSHNPLWPRVYYTFGEDPYLASVMGSAIIRGMQSNNLTAACMKHWIGYSWKCTGHDKDGVTISDFDLMNSYFPTFKAGIDAGLLSGMENYISVNGVPVVENNKLLTKLLRDDVSFDGTMVTDYQEINHLTEFHRTTRSTDEATKFSLKRTSIDMSMVASDGSVRRIVKLKVKLGLYDNPMPSEELLELVGNENDIATALERALFLAGHSAHNIGFQCGGLSVQVQGVDGNDQFQHGTSVKQGFEVIAGNDLFTYFNGLNATGDYTDQGLETTKEYAPKAE
ncbi:hypothetical protein PC112_g18733 [Phytophthora cactorum]|nr:hypothetical protein PC112_g18733 [Phytophthora cactorum]